MSGGFNWSGENEARLYGGIDIIGPVPVNVAFDVIARIGGREYVVDHETARRGEEVFTFDILETVGNGRLLGAKPTPTVDVILRSSEKMARETTDLYEIWDGELVFENIPVKVVLPVVEYSPWGRKFMRPWDSPHEVRFVD